MPVRSGAILPGVPGGARCGQGRLMRAMCAMTICKTELPVRPTILALDLEGTLISNAISQIPRPGLRSFLDEMRSNFDKLVLFTTVPKDRVQAIGTLLAKEGSVPAWFSGLQYIDWSGKTKDLRYVSPDLGNALLLDDHGPYVHPGQEHLWVEIPLFGSPYPPDDNGLEVGEPKQ